MRTLILSALASVAMQLPVYAETDLSGLTPYDLVAECGEAIAMGKEAKLIVDEILGRPEIPLGATSVYDALTCLKTATGDTFRYVDGQFIEASQLIALDQAAREREQAARDQEKRLAAIQAENELQLAQREQIYYAAVVDICLQEYNEDPFRALTTPICGEVFKARGLPIQ